jgi:hypothetical protein
MSEGTLSETETWQPALYPPPQGPVWHTSYYIYAGPQINVSVS